MYSYEDRMRAVQLYIKYDHSLTAVINELGYPSHQMLLQWYREIEQTGNLHHVYKKKSKYTEEQRQKAIEYYWNHGKCISRTARILGYPTRQQLQEWVDAAYPKRKKRCIISNSLVKCTKEQKVQAVIDLCARIGTTQEIASTYGVSRAAVYKWKTQLLSEGSNATMPKGNKSTHSTVAVENERNISNLLSEKETLEKRVKDLERDVYPLQMERDILEKAGEVLKKDQDISLETLTNREKAVVIDALRDKYRLKELLSMLNMAKSSYCYQVVSLRTLDKHTDLRTMVKDAFEEAKAVMDIGAFTQASRSLALLSLRR